MNIVLIGFMGSGKTSVAKKLSQLMHFPIIEMDELVLEKTHSHSMFDVFAKGGEELLRNTEHAIAQEIFQISNCIISTGGGFILNRSILELLKKNKDMIFFLNASFHTILLRLRNDTIRPLFANVSEAQALYDFRHPLYLKSADCVIEVDDKSVEEIAFEIRHYFG